MPIYDREIDGKILDSARAEFLEKGYINASLRNICNKAGVTTGAFYKRYPGKEELFTALVQDVLDDIDGVVADKSINYSSPDISDKQLYDMWTMTDEYIGWWFDFLMERRIGFTLLIKCSEGSLYQNFQHDLVEKVCAETYKCYKEAADRGIARKDVTHRELHVLTTAFWSAMFEPFIHDFSDKEIKLHCELIIKFIDWHKALGFKDFD